MMSNTNIKFSNKVIFFKKLIKSLTTNIFKVLIICTLCFVFYNSIFAQAIDTNKIILQPKLIILNLDSSTYQEIFDGPPATVGMYSGLVTLNPGETVGHHNTKKYEEVLVILSGEGEMTFEGNKPFQLKYGVVAYCPPFTEHDVKNTSSLPLKYIYIASKAK